VISAPSARRRLVGQALRRYRESLGYSLDDAGRIIGCSRSKISRIETGDRGIHVSELQILLTDYGVEDQARAVLAAIAGPRTAKGWWREYSGLLPDAHRDFYVLETVASQILIYEAQRIPELLQTAEYARAFAAANPGLPDDDARAMATEALQGRQNAILHEDGPDIRVILGEAALRQVVGGAAVMQAQLAALANISSGNVHVTVQVLPFTSGAHAAAATGSLAILRSPKPRRSASCTWTAPAAGPAWKTRPTWRFMSGCSSS
jgi:transcriptional regulator with XRE-family HTH domain